MGFFSNTIVVHRKKSLMQNSVCSVETFMVSGQVNIPGTKWETGQNNKQWLCGEPERENRLLKMYQRCLPTEAMHPVESSKTDNLGRKDVRKDAVKQSVNWPLEIRKDMLLPFWN